MPQGRSGSGTDAGADGRGTADPDRQWVIAYLHQQTQTRASVDTAVTNSIAVASTDYGHNRLAYFPPSSVMAAIQ